MSVEAHAESRSNQLAPSRGRFVLPGWRLLVAGPLVAVLTMVAALLTTADAGVPLRDPDNVTGNRLILAVTLIGGLSWSTWRYARGGAPRGACSAGRRSSPSGASTGRCTAGWP